MNGKKSQNLIRVLSLAFVLTFVLAFWYQPVTAYADTLDIKLNVNSKTLVKDKTFELKVYNLSDDQTVVFKSDDTTVVSIDPNGLITALAVGNTIVTATIREEGKTVLSLTCDVTVGLPAISVKLVQPTIFVMVGKQAMLKTILQPLNTVETAKYSGYNSEIASVTTGGRIIARSVGFTYVFVAIDNGKYDLCRVFVLDESTYLEVLENPDYDTESLMREMIRQQLAINMGDDATSDDADSGTNSDVSGNNSSAVTPTAAPTATAAPTVAPSADSSK